LTSGADPDPAAAMIVYLNGEYLPIDRAKISPLDRGFLFADAIYEVARFHRGKPYHLAEHLERMREGLAALRIDVDAGFYPEVARRLLEANDLVGEDAIVYAQVSRGAAPRSHPFPPAGTASTIFGFARRSDVAPAPGGGRAILVPDDRWGRCDIKSVMLLANVLAAERAREAGAIDAILVRDGLALEGTKANLFLASGGAIRTAPNGPRILPGVTRGAAIATARSLGIVVEERAFTVEEMFAADEVFLASTTLWTYPLVEIVGRRIGTGGPGPIAARLTQALYSEFSRG
jgi:D-alanine transaminase